MIYRFRLLLITLIVVCACVPSIAAATHKIVQIYENAEPSVQPNIIDKHVMATLNKHGAEMRNQCSDAVFVRRIYLDMIGTLPTPDETESFLNGARLDKRADLIDDLFTRVEFAEYWSMKWCDILRVKSEFPINLWPNAVQAYHRWIFEAIRDNKPYNRIAWEMLTSSGSNFRVPQVNFYRATQGRDPSSIAKTVALTFMGTRFDRLPHDTQNGMSAFFSTIAYKKTDEWKEEIVYLNPEANKPIKAIFPDGAKVTIPAGADPRKAFANWLVDPKNKWFARNIVNRIWFWTMGQGIIHEPDDIRPDNPAACPELLAALEKELIVSGYNLRHIYKLVFNSRTYQQSSISQNKDDDQKIRFARYQIRRLDAEVLIDALCLIGGEGESYSSPIPEPYTFVPKAQRTIALADASITSSFLAAFGRPSRDTGLLCERNNQPTDTQRMYMLNSSDVQRRLEKSPLLQKALDTHWRDKKAAIRNIYLIILSRYPTSDESAAAEKYIENNKVQRKQAALDVAWALINSKEFLCRH